MKTADEIKKGLEIAVNGCMTCDCCITDCPYDLECHPMNEDTNVDMPKQMAADAIAYIQQLEARNDTLIAKEVLFDEMLAAGAKMERERDAAVEDLRGRCFACANARPHEKFPNLNACQYVPYAMSGQGARECEHWQWRGVRE